MEPHHQQLHSLQKLHLESFEGRKAQIGRKRRHVDTNPFGLSINMVSVSITWKEEKKRRSPQMGKEDKEKNEAGLSQKSMTRPKNVKLYEIRGKILARGLVSSKDYNIQASFWGGLDTIASPKRSLVTLVQPRKLLKAKSMNKLQYLKLHITPCQKSLNVLRSFSLRKGLLLSK